MKIVDMVEHLEWELCLKARGSAADSVRESLWIFGLSVGSVRVHSAVEQQA